MSIDATEHLGTIGRYINHSRNLPNIVPRKVMFIGDDRPHLIFFALRDIVAEEEIVYEYGDDTICPRQWAFLAGETRFEGSLKSMEK